MTYMLEDFQKVGGCGKSTVYATFKLCGITSKGDNVYTKEELERFKLARQMKKERKSDKEIADYFKVNLKTAQQEDSEVDDYVAASCEEAVDIVDMQVAETMVGMYRGSAKKLVNAAPALAVQCLVEELNSEATKQRFAQLRSQLESAGGSPTAFLLQMAKSRRLAPSKLNSISLPAASTESSNTEQDSDGNS
jgi:hypothetical protein